MAEIQSTAPIWDRKFAKYHSRITSICKKALSKSFRLYSFYSSKKALIYDKAPYTVTVYQLYNKLDACLLFRPAVSIQKIDYSFFIRPGNFGNLSVYIAVAE